MKSSFQKTLREKTKNFQYLYICIYNKKDKNIYYG